MYVERDGGEQGVKERMMAVSIRKRRGEDKGITEGGADDELGAREGRMVAVW